MKQTEYVFQRYEKKYLLTYDQYQQLLLELQPYMELDCYGKHTICNIYYDTDSYELIRTSIEKPSYKEKLRIRSYGIPKEDGDVFLELKKKVNGIVYKRRVCLPYALAITYINTGQCRYKTQILKEIDWFINRYHPDQKTFIAYDRMAYFGKEEDTLRITFDFDLRWRKDQVDLLYGDEGQRLLPQDKVLMEIKLPMAMPIWLSNCLNKIQIYPISFSKYGTCYKEHLVDAVKIGG
ncbi:polyphosphate polymerase domain-containing protein [[Eubacterium] hominis]|uniref:polyphosphate polymerase domain-containing protein n=1 Tax=[Eubacterium] hominis TaxID=2764325 RepID=UPI003A4DD0D3